jgi:hypothetical protein
MRIQAALALVIAVVLGTDLYVLTQQGKSTEVTLDQAVDRFRASAPTTVTSAPGPGPTATVAGASPTGASPTTLARSDRGAAPAQQQAAAPVPAPGGPFVAPAEGVYTYRTTGYEEVSLGGARHDYPEQSHAVARRGAGCAWTFELTVLKEHVEKSTHCSAPGRFSTSEEAYYVEFYGQKEGSIYRCDPPMVVSETGDGPGTKRTTTCRGDDGGQATNTTTLLGRERLTIGGTAVDALHLLGEAVISGRAEGTNRSEFWIHPDTGLLLKSVRTSQTRAKAYGTTVDHREEASFLLENLQPRR